MFQENPKLKLSTVLKVLAVLVPIIIYLLSLNEKSLEYMIVSRSELIGEELSIKDLELKIKGESVNKLMLYTFRIRNSGSVPIKKDDFERPISINVPDDTKIYLARLKKKLPENLTLKYEINNNKLLIEPLLLNSDEEFEMELFSSSNAYPTIDVRIVGISKIKEKFAVLEQSTVRSIMLVLSFLLMIIYSKSAFLALLKGVYSSNLLIRLGHGILSLVCGISSILFLTIVIDISNNKILFFSLSLIPVLLGLLWALKEEKYNKTMQPISDTPPDS
jgi:hypothetical protein